MDVQQKLITYHLHRLKDPSASVRLSSIRELRELGGTESLDALKHIFETDRVESVRVAAQQAGLVIFARLKANESTDDAPPP